MNYLKTDKLLITKEVNEHLENKLKRKNFSNGYIFYGPEGIGKKQTAIQFIKEIFNHYSSNAKIEEKSTIIHLMIHPEKNNFCMIRLSGGKK